MEVPLYISISERFFCFVLVFFVSFQGMFSNKLMTFKQTSSICSIKGSNLRHNHLCFKRK